MCSVQGCHENTNKKLSSSDEMTILQMILGCPSMYLHEIQTSLLQLTGTKHSNHLQILTPSGIFPKKIKTYSSTEDLKRQFLSDISLFEPHMFIFVDETGSDKRSTLHKFGYSFKGMHALAEKPLIRGQRYSAIAAMCIDGIIDVQITTGSVNGDTFCDFIKRYLQP